MIETGNPTVHEACPLHVACPLAPRLGDCPTTGVNCFQKRAGDCVDWFEFGLDSNQNGNARSSVGFKFAEWLSGGQSAGFGGGAKRALAGFVGLAGD